MKYFINFSISIIIAFITLLCIISPDISIINTMSEFTGHIMVGFLFLGLVFHLIGNKHLLLVSFLATGALALFLKNASNSDLRFPEIDTNTNIKISHFNLSNIDHNLEDIMKIIQDLDPDIVSFQEFTPEWVNELKKRFKFIYPFSKTMVRIDPFGMAIYSKYPLKNTDILNYNSIPNIVFQIDLNGKSLGLVFSYMLPPALDREVQNTKGHMDFIGQYINNSNLPTILVGDFNVVYWAREITTFRNQYNLNNSRKNASPYGFSVPYDHILYTNEIECSSFKDLVNSQGTHVGISGVFQPKEKMLRLPKPFGLIE